jgi:hypothetical protein
MSKTNKNDTSTPSGTDWARLDAMTDEETDFSDCPEVTPEIFARAIVPQGLQPKLTKEQVTTIGLGTDDEWD